MGIRIKFINPDSGHSREALRIREERLQKAARADTEISMDCLTETEVCIDSLCDVAIAAPEIVQRARAAERDGFDAVCLYCLSDPGLEACREAVSIPVLGGGQVSALVAAGLGYRISLLTTSQRRAPQKRDFLLHTGIDPQRIASVRGVEIPPDAKDLSREEIVEILSKAAKLCCREDGADVVILGCLSFAGMGREVSKAAGIPAVDPAFAMVGMAELLVSNGLSHSKTAYPYPPRMPDMMF